MWTNLKLTFTIKRNISSLKNPNHTWESVTNVIQNMSRLNCTTTLHQELNHLEVQWVSPPSPPLPWSAVTHSSLSLSEPAPADLVAIYSLLTTTAIQNNAFLIKINDLMSILSCVTFHNLNFHTIYSSRQRETWPIVENQGRSVY